MGFGGAVVSANETLCGHERGVWLWALRHWASSPEHARRIANETHPRDETCSAVKDATDPAKLAEFLAAALRERGLHVYDEDPGDSMRLPCVLLLADNGRIWIERFVDWNDCQADPHGLDLDLPQARALLLRILTLPEGATAEDAIRVINGDSFEIPPEIPLREHPEPRQFDPDPDRERDA
jgi:hypothetical protein